MTTGSKRRLKKLRKSIGDGLNNRLKTHGLEDSTDVVAVQAVCDQFAAEMNNAIEHQGLDFPHRWKLTAKGNFVEIGFEGQE